MDGFKIYELVLDCRKVRHKVTQKDLAEAAGIGQTAIHKIIHGQTKSPNPQVLVAIADYFTEALGQKITIDDLIEKDDSPCPVVVKSNRPYTDSKWFLADETESVTDEDFIAISILGDIPCGDLQQMGTGDIVGYQQVHNDRVGRGKFLSKHQGKFHGDPDRRWRSVLIEPGHQWNDKTVVVAYIDGEVACMQLYLYNHSAALVSDKTKYPPIIVTDEMIVIGRVIKIDRNLVENWQP